MSRSSGAAPPPARSKRGRRRSPQSDEAIATFVRVLERLEASVGQVTARSGPPRGATS
ncbi:hypothetical protein ACFQU1_20925 [Chelatococcus sp. GCM10030263]|uniref:hypothetical protein n=1 Tax=Chelatococcus sp. GCM10030263 TaxID=3273387 RepID=UPI00360C9287